MSHIAIATETAMADLSADAHVQNLGSCLRSYCFSCSLSGLSGSDRSCSCCYYYYLTKGCVLEAALTYWGFAKKEKTFNWSRVRLLAFEYKAGCFEEFTAVVTENFGIEGLEVVNSEGA
jgi:hypothetical protein